jgi:hypothetical protein
MFVTWTPRLDHFTLAQIFLSTLKHLFFLIQKIPAISMFVDEIFVHWSYFPSGLNSTNKGSQFRKKFCKNLKTLTLTNLSHKSEELSRKCFALANQFYI